MRNVYLVGFMGSGKSTVGKLISQELGYRFVDIDKEVENQEGITIREIFEKFGEQYFRNLEKEKLKEFIDKSGYVISTGGGLGADKQMMELMKSSGVVIWIDASLEEILNRCQNDTDRPLLKLPYEKIIELYEGRREVYRLADLHIHTDGKTPLQIFEEIHKKLKR
ncbi:MAG: shikimate kinase [Hydrogenothermaceae bacterium]|nr:shikimate kinase [Hydrogenothermaceae bacterium]